MACNISLLVPFKIGESGRSTRELEKTISLLKKIVERSQAEIEQLKKSRTVVSNDALRDLQRDNEGLKVGLKNIDNSHQCYSECLHFHNKII